jgi:hypothetical protein
MGEYRDIAADLREPSRSLRAAIPEVYGGVSVRFTRQHRAMGRFRARRRS